jgi:hypothetical protein
LIRGLGSQIKKTGPWVEREESKPAFGETQPILAQAKIECLKRHIFAKGRLAPVIIENTAHPAKLLIRRGNACFASKVPACAYVK